VQVLCGDDLPLCSGYNESGDSMPFETIDKHLIYDGKKLRLEVHKLRNEATEKVHSREIVVHRGAVVVLPMLEEKTVLLIRQFRYSVRQTLIELPAGTLEKNEDPMNCAGRELLEETGYLAGRMVMLGNFFTSPGILTEKMYAFVALDLEQNRQALEEGEEVELAPTPWDEAIEMIRDGRIVDGKTIATLLMYDRFRKQS
jgi:ADP-ribose pyrophosphatase